MSWPRQLANCLSFDAQLTARGNFLVDGLSAEKTLLKRFHENSAKKLHSKGRSNDQYTRTRGLTTPIAIDLRSTTKYILHRQQSHLAANTQYEWVYSEVAEQRLTLGGARRNYKSGSDSGG